jgi:hypothetical protein
MGTPVRFPFGVTTAPKASPLGMFGLPDPTTWHTYFNDFDEYVVTSRWVETKVGAGTVAVTDADNGVLLVTNAAADNDSVFLQKLGESFLPNSGKRMIGKFRFKVSEAIESEVHLGLMVLDTDPYSATAGDGVTDGLFFMKEDGTANVNFYAQKDVTTGQLTSAAVTTLAADTWTELAFAFDGSRYITLWKDGVQLTTVDLTATLATYLPDTELTVSFGVKNGEAVAKILSVDYVFVAQER